MDRWTILAKCIESAGVWSRLDREACIGALQLLTGGQGEKESDFADREEDGGLGGGGRTDEKRRTGGQADKADGRAGGRATSEIAINGLSLDYSSRPPSQ